jgi:hypothetical protein
LEDSADVSKGAMYIITVLTVAGNEVEITQAWNDEILARNEFLKCVNECCNGKDLNTAHYTFEAIHINMNRVHIYKKSIGYVMTSKDLFKIVQLHDCADYRVTDAE